MAALTHDVASPLGTQKLPTSFFTKGCTSRSASDQNHELIFCPFPDFSSFTLCFVPLCCVPPELDVFYLQLPISGYPWVCVGCCVRAKTHPSPMSLCAHTHTHSASTHALGAHAPLAGTDAVNWTLGAWQSPAEPSGAESSPLGA
ncbi:hypothetical protein AMECASPLE_006951 [Ameca splendens]|uniref:Uncharacterized protein n=1 Tax=Ameca splendens TaxID=208324 RepID=A0ABV0ZW81_9TELE